MVHAKDEDDCRDFADDEIIMALDAVIASKEFSASERSQRFLRYVVGETLAGREDYLKEYTIAVEVFDRDESFDPQTSSIVRVEASRLRSKLKQYYAAAGKSQPIRINIPAGGYVAEFSSQLGAAVPAVEKIDHSRTSQQFRLTSIPLPALVSIAITFIIATILFVINISSHDGYKTSSNHIAELKAAPSIIVLPLNDPSGDQEQDYFVDGLTEGMIASLSKNRNLRVLSYPTSMEYKNNVRPLAEIASELGIEHVMEGTVSRNDKLVRLSLKLIDASNRAPVWNGDFESEITELPLVQANISGEIARSLLGSPMTDMTGAELTSVSPAAYDAFLKGRHYMNQMTEAGFAKGIEFFKDAIRKSPDYAPAHSGMAACHCLLGGHGFEIIEPRIGIPLAKGAVLEALRLDPSLPEAHAFLGIIHLKYDWDWRGAEERFLKSIELNPSYAQARVFYSYYLEAMGRQDEAVYQAEIARLLDPLSPRSNMNLGWQYLHAGRLENARQTFEKMGEFRPNFWGYYWGMGQVYLQDKELDQAIAEFKKSVEAGGGHAMPIASLGYAYALAGRRQEALEMISALNALAEKGYVSPFNFAIIYAGLDETDLVFAELEKALEQRSRSMAWLNVTPELRHLHDDLRFTSLLQRIGLDAEVLN